MGRHCHGQPPASAALARRLHAPDCEARAGFNPDSAIGLWEQRGRAEGANGVPGFLSTHPSGPDRIERLRENIPQVRGLYRDAVARR
jgi:predicted Zn-dependent protease